jgi:c(7)-type cytochrome triheme protein
MFTSVITSLLLFVFLFTVPCSTFAVAPGKTLTWQGGGQGAVIFEGEEHARKGYACRDCHPGLFAMKKDAAKMTMEALNQGKYCGACHNGNKAFGTDDPKHCHECHDDNTKHHDKHKKKDHHD